MITLEWIGRAENLVIADPDVRHGKVAPHRDLAQAAIEKGMRVSWFILETLSTTISKSKVDGSTARAVARICRADLIVIDDIGLLPVDEDAAEAFYRIIDAAHERRSTAVPSNIQLQTASTRSHRRLSRVRPPTASCTRSPRDHHR
ncbi:ATP-binding protein [Streptomyces sp. CoH27]|uniref:ATP-binding protein n=1 Tax=Streptomyces sp. CoH27 TaxID=2875763 RepID=UPI0021E61D32|nr:ATP-binding protein [Streptomyces sp. CoH27]